jgi:hypothetical protein
VFFSILISINSQRGDERDLPPERLQIGRTSKSSFDVQFNRGRCPPRFYQSGDECLYFLTDGKHYSWQHAERICSERIAGMLGQQQTSSINNQPNMTPTKDVRQLILNTPEKTEIFRALLREYDEQNFAVRLPSDYNTLPRCHDGQDDRWPNYCTNSPSSDTTCFEINSHSPNNTCLKEVDCNQRYLRIACEFTLPGSAEITTSKFRHCPKPIPLRRRLPKWAWITIGVGSGVLLFIILAVIVACICKSKNKSPSKNKFLPEPRSEITPIRVKRDDPAAEPMLIRAAPANVSDPGYLQPRSSERVLPPTRNTTENV